MTWLIPLDHFESWDRGVLQLPEGFILALAINEQAEQYCAGVELIEREIQIIMTTSKHHVNANKQFKGK